jgi:hypothetical protein
MGEGADEKHEKVNRKKIEKCAVTGVNPQDQKQYSTPEKQLGFH